MRHSAVMTSAQRSWPRLSIFTLIFALVQPNFAVAGEPCQAYCFSVKEIRLTRNNVFNQILQKTYVTGPNFESLKSQCKAGDTGVAGNADANPAEVALLQNFDEFELKNPMSTDAYQLPGGRYLSLKNRREATPQSACATRAAEANASSRANQQGSLLK